MRVMRRCRCATWRTAVHYWCPTGTAAAVLSLSLSVSVSPLVSVFCARCGVGGLCGRDLGSRRVFTLLGQCLLREEEMYIERETHIHTYMHTYMHTLHTCIQIHAYRSISMQVLKSGV